MTPPISAGSPPLAWQALDRHQYDEAINLAKQGADLGQLGPDGDNALHKALKSRSSEAAITLFQIAHQTGQAAAILALDAQGESLLGRAIEREWNNAARQLVLAGADLAGLNRDGIPMLVLCISTKQFDLSCLLLANAGSRAALAANAKDSRGETALIHAVRKGWTGVASYLAAAGADLAAIDERKTPAISLSIASGYSELAAALITKAAQAHDAAVLDAPDSLGRTALIHAVGKGWTGVASALASAGANLAAIDERKTPAISLAITLGHSELASALIANAARTKNTAALDAPDALGQSALIHAVNKGWTGVASYLAGSGANIAALDESKTPAISIAIALGHSELAAALIANAARTKNTAALDAPDSLGRTALIHAVGKGWITTASALASAGANIAAFDQRKTPAISLAITLGHSELASALIANAARTKNTASLDAPDAFGRTALIHAVEKNWTEVAAALAGAGANLAAVDERRIPAISLAIVKGHSGLAQALIAKAAHLHDIDALDALGQSALIHAVHKGWIGVASALASAGANLAALDERKTPAISLAIASGYSELAAALIANAAKANDTAAIAAADPAGETALSQAIKKNWDNTVTALLQAGAPLCSLHIDSGGAQCSSNALALAVRLDRPSMARALLAAAATRRDHDARLALARSNPLDPLSPSCGQLVTATDQRYAKLAAEINSLETALGPITKPAFPLSSKPDPAIFLRSLAIAKADLLRQAQALAHAHTIAPQKSARPRA